MDFRDAIWDKLDNNEAPLEITWTVEKKRK
jgi:hypothetical protein